MNPDVCPSEAADRAYAPAIAAIDELRQRLSAKVSINLTPNGEYMPDGNRESKSMAVGYDRTPGGLKLKLRHRPIFTGHASKLFTSI